MYEMLVRVVNLGWFCVRGCCRGVEELLERISNGKLADDRRSAMAELEAAVAENRAAKLAFGSMGKQ